MWRNEADWETPRGRRLAAGSLREHDGWRASQGAWREAVWGRMLRVGGRDGFSTRSVNWDQRIGNEGCITVTAQDGRLNSGTAVDSR